jgi:hypothetical protein
VLHAPAHPWRSENYASGGRKYKYHVPRQLKNKLSEPNMKDKEKIFKILFTNENDSLIFQIWAKETLRSMFL